MESSDSQSGSTELEGDDSSGREGSDGRVHRTDENRSSKRIRHATDECSEFSDDVSTDGTEASSSMDSIQGLCTLSVSRWLEHSNLAAKAMKAVEDYIALKSIDVNTNQ